MTDPTLRLATVDDAVALAAFGERTFRETFDPHTRPEDVDAYCAATYGAELQRREIADPDRHVLLAHAGDELIGYAQLRAGRKYPCVTGSAPIELLRFYVDRRWHGRGVAARLMDAMLDEAAARGARTMYLAVFEHNVRARAFYGKHGFVQAGAVPFPIGTSEQIDLIMVRALEGVREISRSA